MSTLTATIIADFTTTLATALSVGGTTATLSSATDDDNISLPTGRYFFTLDGPNSSKEHTSCTLTGTALTNIKTVSRQGVETAGVLRVHRIGASVSITDFAHILQINNLVKGTTALDASVPLGYDGTASITTANQLTTKTYVDGVAVAGAPNASTTVKGIIETATQAEVIAKTTTGGTGALLVVTPDTLASTLLSDYKVDTGAANAYVITPAPAITAYTTGQIFSFKATNANTTASTVNVNGLGVKTIKKLGGATDLASGDIAAGMIVELEYDGTNFLMLNPVANAPITAVTDIQAFSTAGTTSWTKPTNAKWVDVTVMGAGGAGGSGNNGANANGGSGGGYAVKRFAASVLGSTETIVVGAAGVAGANNTAGGNGGFSAFGTTVLLRADGGNGGSGSATQLGGSSNGDVHYAGGSTGSGFAAAGFSTSTDPSPRSGGNGGYNGGTPATATAGGNGGGFTTYYVKAGGLGGAAGVNAGVAATSTTAGLLYGGVGGGGGGFNGSGTGTGGNGGAGGFPGGGGGGSVGTNNTGGNGADGMIYIVTYF